MSVINHLRRRYELTDVQAKQFNDIVLAETAIHVELDEADYKCNLYIAQSGCLVMSCLNCHNWEKHAADFLETDETVISALWDFCSSPIV